MQKSSFPALNVSDLFGVIRFKSGNQFCRCLIDFLKEIVIENRNQIKFHVNFGCDRCCREFALRRNLIWLE